MSEFDKFTNPIQGSTQTLTMPATAKTLEDAGVVKKDKMQLMLITFEGAIGDVVGRTFDDGTAPDASNGIEILGKAQAVVTEESFDDTQIIAIGTPVNFTVQQYESENLHL